MMKAKTKWQATDTTDHKYVGIIEFQDIHDEWHDFYVIETTDRLVFGGCCNVGFMESGYIEKDNETTDETLAEMLADLEVYYNDGPQYTNRIICNECM